MTKRIFRSILVVSLAVLLASLLLIVGVLHGYFQDSVLADLTIRTSYIAHGIENEGISYLNEDLPEAAALRWWTRTALCFMITGKTLPRWKITPTGRRSMRRQSWGRATRSATPIHLSEKTIYYALRLSDGTILRVSDTEYSVWRLVIQAMQRWPWCWCWPLYWRWCWHPGYRGSWCSPSMLWT